MQYLNESAQQSLCNYHRAHAPISQSLTVASTIFHLYGCNDEQSV